MANRRNNKITHVPGRFQRVFQDYGILLFTIIAIYMLVCLVIYWSKPHISIYEVKHGSIAKDYSYTGVILRTEEIINADRSGYMTYYAREGQKVGAKTTICAIDETGQMTELLEQATAEQNLLTAEDILTFKSEVQAYQTSYDNQNFSEVYDFKRILESKVMESVHLKLLNTATQSVDTSALVNIYKSASDGVLSYNIDGMENLTLESITPENLDSSKYQSTDLKQQTLVNPSEPMYKLITEDDWSVVVEMDKELAKTLVEEEYIEITFLKDNKTAWGQVTAMEHGDSTFVQFTFTNSMVRYAAERYLDIRFHLNDDEGLKIPVSAIAEEDYYEIPVDYLTKGGNQNQVTWGVNLESYGEDGSFTNKYLTLVTGELDKDAEFIYVSPEIVKAGDQITMENSSERYTIGKTGKVEGVYNINKGYTVFYQIEVLCKNSEYYIVDATKSSGLSQYDRIVLNADTVENDKTLY